MEPKSEMLRQVQGDTISLFQQIFLWILSLVKYLFGLLFVCSIIFGLGYFFIFPFAKNTVLNFASDFKNNLFGSSRDLEINETLEHQATENFKMKYNITVFAKNKV